MCEREADNTDAGRDEFIVSTGPAGVAPGTALSAVPPLALWNPGNSRYFVDIVAAWGSYLSGTLGGGALCLSFGKQTGNPVTPGAILTPVNRITSGSPPPDGLNGFQLATLENVPQLLRPIGQLGAFVATTPWPIDPVEEIPCRLTLAPGYVATLQAIGAAGVAPLVLLGLAFRVRPVKV